MYCWVSDLCVNYSGSLLGYELLYLLSCLELLLCYQLFQPLPRALCVYDMKCTEEGQVPRFIIVQTWLWLDHGVH